MLLQSTYPQTDPRPAQVEKPEGPETTTIDEKIEARLKRKRKQVAIRIPGACNFILAIAQHISEREGIGKEKEEKERRRGREFRSTEWRLR